MYSSESSAMNDYDNSFSSSQSSSSSSVISSRSSSSSLLSSVNSSILQEYFQISVNKKFRSGKCKSCSNVITIKDGSNGNFINHLKSHGSAYADYCEKQGIKRDVAVNKRHQELATQTLIPFPIINKDTHAAFLDSLALFMAATGLPHLMIQNPLFQEMLNKYALCTQSNSITNRIIPSHRTAIRKRILAIGNEIFTSILSFIGKPKVFTTLAIDGWTGHTYGGKNTNIIAIAQKQAYLLWSDRNDDTDDSAATYLAPLITEKIEFLMQREVAVIAFTTDNAANMRLAGDLLYQNPKFGRVVLRISCSAHVIQIMIKDILALEPLASLFNNCVNLLQIFKSQDSKGLRLELRRMQKRTSDATPKKIMFYNDTRWWSKSKSIERLLELRPYLSLTPANPDIPLPQRKQLALFAKNEFWEQLTEFMVLLNCFQRATDLVQASDATLLSLNDALTGIENFIRNWDLASKLKVQHRTAEVFRISAVKAIEACTNAYVSYKTGEHHAVHAIQLLCRDTKGWNGCKDTFNNTVEWTAIWGAELLLLYPKHFPTVKQPIDDEKARSVKQLEVRIRQQIANFQGSLDYFSNSEYNQSIYRQPVSVNSFNFDENKPAQEQTQVHWQQYWSMYLTVAPELASVALSLLSIGISEAMCERSFSIQQLTHSKVRNKLDDDIVEAEMRIRFNKNLLQLEVDELMNMEASDDEEIEHKHAKKQKTDSSRTSSSNSNFQEYDNYCLDEAA